jgi:hypothetical protein
LFYAIHHSASVCGASGEKHRVKDYRHGSDAGAGVWKVEIKTQFASGGTLLKEPRVIESAFALTVA